MLIRYSSDFDAIDQFIDDLFVSFEANDIDYIQGPQQLKDYREISADELRRKPSTIPADIRRRIGYGEITSTDNSAVGLANLNQDMIYSNRRLGVGGLPVLVQYDNAGNVIARVLDEGQQRVLWQGKVGRIRMPTPNPNDTGAVGRAVEEPIRALMGRLVGGSPRIFTRQGNSSNEPGADMIRNNNQRRVPVQTRSNSLNKQSTTRRTQQRVAGRRNNRGNRFEETDAFFDNLIDDYLLG